MIHVLGINGSPRQGGNSEWALRELLAECEKLNAQTEALLLSTSNIQMCAGCLTCEDQGTCPLNDDMKKINERLSKADVLVFSSPAYFDNVSGLMKNFMDRTNPIVEKLKGKKAAIIIVGQTEETSWVKAAQAIETYCSIVGIDVIGQVFGKARKMHELMQNDKIKRRLRDLAKAIMNHAKTSDATHQTE